MRLRPILTVALAAAVAAGPVAAAPTPSAKPAAESARARPTLRVSETDAGGRLAFAGGAPTLVRQGPGEVVLRFTAGDPDLGRLAARPPAFLAGVSPRRVPGGLELTLALAPGVKARAEASANALVLEMTRGPVDAVAAAPERPSPVPASGVVKVGGEAAGSGLTYRFDWAAPVAAAVFRRGDAVWIVFDAAARLDAAAAPKGKGVTAVAAVSGPGYAALRLAAGPGLRVGAQNEGARWTVTLAPAAPSSAPVALAREADDAVLTARLAGATAVRAVQDPVVGDVLTVVTALGPAKGFASRREYVDLALLPSAHGLAVEPLADDLRVEIAGEHVRLGRPSGLALSAAGSARAEAAAGAPKRASLPGLVDFTGWSKTGSGGYLARHAALQSAVAEAEGEARREPAMALARFLIGSELAHEALGVLNHLKRTDQTLAADPEVRALHGAANAMAGRYKEAAADLASPALAADPASALWRGYAAERMGDAETAAAGFAQGAPALPLFAPAWRARFARSAGLTALARGDLPAARRALAAAAAERVDETETARTLFAQARLLEAEGAGPAALAAYERLVKRAPYEGLAAPALLRATELKLKSGAVAPDEAADTLTSLRWRWRGGETELDAVRALGRLHLGRGQYREGLAALRSASAGLKDSDAGLALHAELLAAFRGLFLDGGADGLEPIQALGLFYDFRDAVPIGADGDLMVRRLARRLVDVDLLPQAAELLRYQAAERLDGVPRAQVSTDLALVLLMDRKPQDALKALNESRTTLLPPALAAERRLIEARALAAVGRGDHALEILEGDNSADALDVKAEVAWAAAEWAKAAPLLERALGDRWKAGALAPADESRLLRAGAAYSLAGDAAALARLRGRWAKHFDGARSPDALRVALADGDEAAAFSPRPDVPADGFSAWVQAMKARFREKPVPVPALGRQAAAPAPTAAG